VRTLSAAFAAVRRPVVAATVQMKTVNKKALRVEAVAYEDPEGDRQLLSRKRFCRLLLEMCFLK
jgi:hypothetical protein